MENYPQDDCFLFVQEARPGRGLVVTLADVGLRLEPGPFRFIL